MFPSEKRSRKASVNGCTAVPEEMAKIQRKKPNVNNQL